MALVIIGINIEARSNSNHLYNEDQQSDEHNYVLNPEEERKYFEEIENSDDFEVFNFKFPQEYWFECRDEITGNFLNYKCASKRQISSILNEYIKEYISGCVQESLDSINGGTIESLHIVHDGILGDRRHSPKSLHAENRAIDIRIFEITTTEGKKKKFVYEDKKNRDFFMVFRTCWGRTINENNNCPIFEDSLHRTGSIGWEDKDHQHHMHTSVPFCVNGDYDVNFFRR